MFETETFARDNVASLDLRRVTMATNAAVLCLVTSALTTLYSSAAVGTTFRPLSPSTPFSVHWMCQTFTTKIQYWDYEVEAENLAPHLSKTEVLAPNFAYFDKHFPTRRKFFNNFPTAQSLQVIMYCLDLDYGFGDIWPDV